MLLSVVIPAYRRPAWLGELLTALVPQLAEQPGSEAVVVDNDPDASARGVADGFAAAGVRYVHETRRGVVHARNRGVAEARGTHIVFIDDDEVPRAGWLAAFAAAAATGASAAFGRVVPRFDGVPPAGLETLLAGLFSRDLDAAAGSDVTARWSALGTGNSLFEVATCFATGAPFDAAFNARGGEDIDMIRRLTERGVRLTWVPDAVVDELVPAARMTAAAVARRKFNDGQLRVISTYGAGGAANTARAAVWSGVGAVQVALHGAGWLALRATGSPGRHAQAARLHAGLGKLLWWRAPPNIYAG